jgi:hypothetical protein
MKKAYWMRDNHTFRPIPLDMEEAIEVIREEFTESWAGTLCSKVAGTKMLHGTNTEFTAFEPLARKWLQNYYDLIQKEPEPAWVGCSECDCTFSCYDGKARCIRLEPIRTPDDEQGGYQTERQTQKIGVDTPLDQLTDFQKGARAMFDVLHVRAANNWHPRYMDSCDKENKLIQEWATDALGEVDPNSLDEWKTADQMFTDGVRLGKAQAYAEKTNTVIVREFQEMNIAIYMGVISSIFMSFGCVGMYRGAGWTTPTFVLIAFNLVLLMCTGIVFAQQRSLRRVQKNGFYPPAPLPPSRPPEGWSPKM